MQLTEFFELNGQLARVKASRRRTVLEVLCGDDTPCGATAFVEGCRQKKFRCPHCRCKRSYASGWSSGLRRWRRKNNDCCKIFKILAKAPRAWLRHQKLWLLYGWTQAGGIRLRNAPEHRCINLLTAFRRPLDFSPAPASIVGPKKLVFSSPPAARLVERSLRKFDSTASSAGVSDEHMLSIARACGSAVVRGILALRKFAPAKDVLITWEGAEAYGALVRTLAMDRIDLDSSTGDPVEVGVHYVQNVNSCTGRLEALMPRDQRLRRRPRPPNISWPPWLPCVRFGQKEQKCDLD